VMPSGLAEILNRAAGGDPWGPRPYADVCASLPAGKLLKVGGQRVHVEQAGQGEPLVLLHGFGCSTHSWRLVIPGLARRHRVVAIDLNGFGWTERPSDVAAYTYEGQAKLVLAVLDRLGIDEFHLAGHSYGGGLALWLSGRHRQRVRSLTLLCSVLPDYGQAQRQAWARFRSLNWLLVHFFVLSRAAVRKALELCYHDRSIVTDDLVEDYRQRMLVEGVEDAYYGLMAPLDMPSPDVDLATVAVPTLVIWGECDKLIPFAEARPHLERLPHVEMASLPACGHSPMEERPEELLARWIPFLERHRAGWSQRVRKVWRRLGRAAAV